MTFPIWLRLLWWGAFVVTLAVFLSQRFESLASGAATPFDIVAFLVFVGLLMMPIASEATIFGFGYKQAIAQLRTDVQGELVAVRMEVATALSVQNINAPQFVFPAPPGDAQLPAIEERVRATVASVLQDYTASMQRPPATPTAPSRDETELAVASDTLFLLSARYSIERQLRLIASINNLQHESARPLPITQLLRVLAQAELLRSDLASAIRDVYAICSAAIHAESVTPAQVAFVREVTPGLVKALRAIGKTTPPTA